MTVVQALVPLLCRWLVHLRPNHAPLPPGPIQVGNIPENVLSKMTAKILKALSYLHRDKHMVRMGAGVWGANGTTAP